MGWSSREIPDNSLKGIKEEILKELNTSYLNKEGILIENKVIYSSFSFGEMYAAVNLIIHDNKEKSINNNIIYAVCVMWQCSNNELITKCMSEECDPFMYRPPKKLLNLLTETTNKNTLAWRFQCWKRFKRIPEKIKNSIEFNQ